MLFVGAFYVTFLAFRTPKDFCIEHEEFWHLKLQYFSIKSTIFWCFKCHFLAFKRQKFIYEMDLWG